MAVEATPDALRFIAEHGGRVYVYTVGEGLKQVKTDAPDDPSIRFEQVNGDGFQLFVESDLEKPETWYVKLRHFPHTHLDVLWDGHEPGQAGNVPVSNVQLVEDLLIDVDELRGS